MIKLTEIQKALANMLRQKFNTYGIYFDNVAKSQNKSFFYVEMFQRNTTVDECWSDRSVFIDIAFIPLKDENNRVKRADLYNLSNELEKLLYGGIWVNTRHISIYNTDIHIVDDVLHYSFSLDYADGDEPIINNELMQELEIKIKK